jgi:hypothetical protein
MPRSGTGRCNCCQQPLLILYRAADTRMPDRYSTGISLIAASLTATIAAQSPFTREKAFDIECSATEPTKAEPSFRHEPINPLND